MILKYSPVYDISEEGYWDRSGDEPKWVQNHDVLVKNALSSWIGDPVTMVLQIRDERDGVPMPASGSGKQMRVQAQSLLWEIEHEGHLNSFVLYRGSHEYPVDLQSWSSNLKVAQKWAKKGGGDVYITPKKSVRGIRFTDYGINTFSEREWLVDCSTSKEPFMKYQELKEEISSTLLKYTLREYPYAKDKVLLSYESEGMFKGTIADLAEALGGRYVHRFNYRGYLLSPKRAETWEKMYLNGWTGFKNPFGGTAKFNHKDFKDERGEEIDMPFSEAMKNLPSTLKSKKITSLEEARADKQEGDFSDAAFIPTGNFDLSIIDNRRWMFNPRLNQLVLGMRKPFIGNRLRSTHADEFVDARAKGKFDDNFRGWLGFGGKYKNGILHFAPSVSAEQMKDPEMFDEVLKTIQFFLKHGFNQNSILRSCGYDGEQKIKDAFPELFMKNESFSFESVIFANLFEDSSTTKAGEFPPKGKKRWVTHEDADHHMRLNTEHEYEIWLGAANGAYEWKRSKGGNPKECEAYAVPTANSAVSKYRDNHKQDVKENLSVSFQDAKKLQRLSSNRVAEMIDENTDAKLNVQAIKSKLAKQSPYFVKTMVPLSSLTRLGDSDVDIKNAHESKGAIVVGDDGEIYDGRHRAALAKSKGLKEIEAWVPVIMPKSTNENLFTASNVPNIEGIRQSLLEDTAFPEPVQKVIDAIKSMKLDTAPNFKMTTQNRADQVPTVSLQYFINPKDNRPNVIQNLTLSFTSLSKTKASFVANGGNYEDNVLYKFLNSKNLISVSSVDMTAEEFISLLKQVKRMAS